MLLSSLTCGVTCNILLSDLRPRSNAIQALTGSVLSVALLLPSFVIAAGFEPPFFTINLDGQSPKDSLHAIIFLRWLLELHQCKLLRFLTVLQTVASLLDQATILKFLVRQGDSNAPPSVFQTDLQTPYTITAFFYFLFSNLSFSCLKYNICSCVIFSNHSLK